MEELEIDLVAEKALSFRIKDFKPLKFFSKFFMDCYSIVDIDNLLTKATILKENAEDKIKELSISLKSTEDKLLNKEIEFDDMEESYKKLMEINSNLEKDLLNQKEKHSKEIEKLAKTISDLQYSKSNLETEVIGLRNDLNDCNRKFELKTNNNNKENGQFIDKVIKKNEKLETELKAIKDFLKKKKIKIEL